MSAKKRDKNITILLDEIFTKSKIEQSKPNLTNRELLRPLFNKNVWGFREILLVILIARILNPRYKASSGLYECNPRAMYEGPIRDGLLSREIPRRKSGPLNIAKATPGINKEWAAQRRPLEVAKLLVEIVKKIETQSARQNYDLTVSLCALFLDEAKNVEELIVKVDPQSDPFIIYELCFELIRSTPDAGNTPQKIIGLLLSAYHAALRTNVKVTGLDDRASTTSTTSKKPGDINEELSDGGVLKIYEVTVKKFSESRVIESYDTVSKFRDSTKQQISEIIVICRKEDVHPNAEHDDVSTACLGGYIYKDLTYLFLDIYDFIQFLLIKIPVEGRYNFFRELEAYIANPNTALKVKLKWKELVSKLLIMT